MDHALILVLALLANLCFGGPRALYEASGLARFGRIPAKLLRDRERRYAGRPVLLIAYGLFSAFCAGVFLHILLRGPLVVLQPLLIACLLPVRQTLERAWAIKKALSRGDVPAARQALDGTVWKHHILLDAPGAARAGIELLAVGGAMKILPPILWYVVAGLPGLFVCKAVGLMQEILPSGFAPARHANQLLLQLPAASFWLCSRLLALLWLGAQALLFPAGIQKAASDLSAQALRLPAMDYTLYTAARLMTLSLGGPTSAYVNTRWLGDGSPKPTPADVGRACALFALVTLYIVIALVLTF